MFSLPKKSLSDYLRFAVISIPFGVTVFAYGSANVDIEHHTSPIVINTGVSPSFDAFTQKHLAEQPSKIGLANHYDEELGKATFVWASGAIQKPDMSDIRPEMKAEYAANYYMSSTSDINIDKGSMNNANMVYMHDIGKGALVAKYRQEINGIEVFKREMNVAMDREYNLVATSGYFSRSQINESDFDLLQHFGAPELAIQRAVRELSQTADSILLDLGESKEQYEWFDVQILNSDLIVTTARAKKVFFDSSSEMRPAYYIEVGMADKSSTDSSYYGYVVDAENGKVLFKNNMIQQEAPFTYRAYLNSTGYPLESPHGDVIPTPVRGQDPTVILPAPLVTLSSFVEFSRQEPWLPVGATSTEGNNVFAYADLVEPDGFGNGDIRTLTTSDGVFDYQLSGNEDSQSVNNINAAVVNLFVVNNFLHDYYYDFGFDEISGNGQDNNFGRGGLGNDAINAEAQDFDGLNNANMLTPADGASGRMQQFLFNSKDALEGIDFGVNVTTPNIGSLRTEGAAFGPVEYNITGRVIRMLDESTGPEGTGTEFDGCEAPTNAQDIADNIAIVDRGECNFTVKVLNAQSAGAIGIVIVNNREDNGLPPRLGGEDDTITIPARSLAFTDGPLIYDVIDDGQDLTAQVFDNFVLKDSTFDNGIIAHEFGHFIQNRLIGNGSGLTTLQSRALGEGWSDFHALLFTALEEDAQIAGNDQFQINYGVGTFVVDFFTGIRRGPYSTDMEVNPLTFTHIQNGAEPPGFPPTNASEDSPHPPGELWAVSLWDIYVGLINTHGFQEAQDRMSGYVIAGLKLTPINPLYTEARDALLAAISVSDQNDFVLALNAFARRGLGFGAVSPPRDSEDLVGAIQSFSRAPVSFNASNLMLTPDFNSETLGFCSNDGILDVGEIGVVSFSISNSGDETLSGITAQLILVDVSGQPLPNQNMMSFENNGQVDLGELAAFSTSQFGPILATLNEASIGETINLQLMFSSDDANSDISIPSPLTASNPVNFDFVEREIQQQTTVDNMETLSVFNDWVEDISVGGNSAVNTRRLDRLETPFFQTRNPSIDLGLQSQVINNNSFSSDVRYETRVFTVGDGDDFSMSFWHFYDFEQGRDGGVIEISIEDGDWVDVTEAGGVFDVGYPDIDTSLSTVLSGRLAFTGINAASGLPIGETGHVETLSFGDALNGQQVRLRLRVLTDQDTGGEGWRIDNVIFNNITSTVFSEVIAGNDSRVICDSLPLIRLDNTFITLDDNESGSFVATVFNRNNPDAAISYSWRQVTGPNVESFSGEDSPSFNFVPAPVTEDTDLAFELEVSDGIALSTALANVTVSSAATQTPPAPTPSPVPTPAPAAPPTQDNSSGGGSIYWLLGVLPLVLARRISYRWVQKEAK
jgi:hypothetical protein